MKLKVWLLIVKSKDSERLTTVQVFNKAETARKHSDEWLALYNDITAEVRPQIVCEE